MTPTMNGYYRDVDTVGYVSKDGTLYLVERPDDLEPVWLRCDMFSEDAELAKNQSLNAEYEPTRIAYGIDV